MHARPSRSPTPARLPQAPRPTATAAVDVARLAALVVVMFGHCALLLATIDSNGLWIGNLLGELPAIAPVTWVVQVMPLFFLAGGAAGAYGWREGTQWGTWLFSQGAATVSAGVLVSRVLDGRPVRRRPGARAGVRRCHRARVGGTSVVPRRLSRGARVRACADPAADRARRRRRGRVPSRGRRGVRRNSVRRRHAHGGGRQLRRRLADPRRHRRGVRAPVDRCAGRTRRRGISVRRAGAARRVRAV